ncbi:MAG: ABC transporter permease subunit [Candidatus Hodarchaeales archaeon]|jgi:ABC-type transport system involved in multi-copper enzyme maturation permease subunit
MVNVFKKEMKKGWLVGLIPPLIPAIFVAFMAPFWPQLKDSIGRSLAARLENPIFQAVIGTTMGDLGTWNAAYFMYIFVTIEFVLMFVVVFLPVLMVSMEVEKSYLDTMLSYPIARWRFILEKFSVYLGYNLLYIPFVFITSFIGTELVGETLNYEIVVYSLIGVWAQLFALGAISLLCTTVFLNTMKSIAVAGGLVMGQMIIGRIAGLIPDLSFLKQLSLFNYFSSSSIRAAETVPFGELAVLIVVGIVALVSALVVFQKREFAY